MSTLKLSDAIRLGSMLKPQGHGDLYVGGATCAMGAAADAIGKLTDKAWMAIPGWAPFVAEFPVLAALMGQPCPVCHYKVGPSGLPITHLNDRHRWTREQIADFVETLEQAQAAGAVDPSVSAEGAGGTGTLSTRDKVCS